MQADWSLLASELSLWAGAGLAPRLWLRDDDAVSPSHALDRLLALCDRYQAPVVLAVVPEPTGAELARRLDGNDLASIAVHGWRHANYAPSGEKKQELGKHRPAAEIVAELGRGLSKLSTLHGEKSLPILVPPWNRIDLDLLPGLRAAGFRAVSAFANKLVLQETDELAIINAHLDIIDWSTRRGREPGEFATLLVDELRKSRQAGGYPIGILSHHMVHDETAWDFLDQLLEMTALGNSCKWLSGQSLLQSRRATTA